MNEPNIHLSFSKGHISKPSLLLFACGNACFFGKAMSIFRLHMCGFNKGYESEIGSMTEFFENS